MLTKQQEAMLGRMRADAHTYNNGIVDEPYFHKWMAAEDIRQHNKILAAEAKRQRRSDKHTPSVKAQVKPETVWMQGADHEITPVFFDIVDGKYVHYIDEVEA